MPSTKVILLVVLGLVAAAYAFLWYAAAGAAANRCRPGRYALFVGFVTNFFDALGVGSFATTTALYRLQRTVADEHLPGTLNVGHCLPTVVQAFVFVSIVEVDERTLIFMILAGILGAWLGAGIVTRLSRRAIQAGLGTALLAAAALMFVRLIGFVPGGGDALALNGSRLAIGMSGNFVFGGLMMIGVGAYAPIMIMVSLLGMNPKTAFPIMMGSCAFLTPVGSLRFLRAGNYDLAAAVGLTLGGIPAVLIAAFLIRELPLDAVRWAVIAIALVTALGLLRDALKSKSAASASSPAAVPTFANL
ncbi:MAG: TSUP family transporter [Pirellulales bacterium]